MDGLKGGQTEGQTDSMDLFLDESSWDQKGQTDVFDHNDRSTKSSVSS